MLIVKIKFRNTSLETITVNFRLDLQIPKMLNLKNFKTTKIYFCIAKNNLNNEYKANEVKSQAFVCKAMNEN